MHIKEIESVSSLIPIERYKYVIKKIADSEKVYSLESKDGRWVSFTVKKQSLYPIWSAKEFALNCAVEDWSEFNIIEVPLNEFVEIKLKDVVNNGFLINVFPVRDLHGFIIKPTEFLRDLNCELENYK